jgi:predicted enzyme related to lactoylglutathione lyase
MGRPVVHFEVIGKDAATLHGFYSRLFDWRIQADNEMAYGLVPRDGNTSAEGVGIGGGVGAGPDGYEGHVTFYVEVPDVGQALSRAEELGGSRIFGPDQPPGLGLTLGQFSDPEGHVIGLVQPS